MMPPKRCPSSTSTCRCRLDDEQLLAHVVEVQAVTLGRPAPAVVLEFVGRTIGLDADKHRAAFVALCAVEAAARNRGGGWHTHKANRPRPRRAPKRH